MLNTRLGFGRVAPFIIALAVLSVPAFADVGVGDKAPDFQLDRIGSSGTVKLSSYTNKPTLVVFWLSGCPHCQHELPILNSMYKSSLKPKGVNMIGVSADQSLDRAAGFVKLYSLNFPNAFAGTDDGVKILMTYGVRGVPVTYLIDKKGKVRAIYLGEVNARELKSDLAKLGVK